MLNLCKTNPRVVSPGETIPQDVGPGAIHARRSSANLTTGPGSRVFSRFGKETWVAVSSGQSCRSEWRDRANADTARSGRHPNGPTRTICLTNSKDCPAKSGRRWRVQAIERLTLTLHLR